ncbi:MAG: NifB/NifX family molybdenum-iron cluster-binding protein [Deltaproteobacteria bacterium]|nr:NifB/NifX family molybdenum-iron cluster-binding protein [Deltaproteobacteria bacterium]MBW2515715.1 NifB/NifX family molybdenum-iron cluster-binding protein [Deltaproteobacteria bacterium]
MKIAISSSGNTLDSAIDPRFGRCAYFLIVDPADMRYEAFDNQGAAQSHGAGIQAAQFLANHDVSAVITGHVGPNAIQTLAAAGIDIFAEQRGTVEQVVNEYKSGALKPASQPTVGRHFGMGGRRSTGQGAGRGMGMGGGRGMGRGDGMRRR